MRTLISRWFMFGLLLGWALTHATVFGQPASKSTDKATSALDKVRAALDKTITVDYTGQSLVEALNHIRDKSGVPINVDQMTLMQIGMDMPGGDARQVKVKATNEKTSQVLRKMLNAHQLCYVLFEDSVLITTEEMAAMRQYRQRVSIDLDEVPLKKAVRDLARSHGINLVIDPRVMKQAEAPVSLQLDNTGVETALRLLAELANLKAVRMGNVMYVTHEERAKKIREEEAHQFDNPFNPNLPSLTMPPMMRFGNGGGFGGAGPAVPALPQGVPNAAPPPPTGIDLPVEADPAPKKGQTAPSAPPVPQPPTVERPALDRLPAPPRVIRN